jgi:hypothetical protein
MNSKCKSFDGCNRVTITCETLLTLLRRGHRTAELYKRYSKSWACLGILEELRVAWQHISTKHCDLLYRLPSWNGAGSKATAEGWSSSLDNNNINLFFISSKQALTPIQPPIRLGTGNSPGGGVRSDRAMKLSTQLQLVQRPRIHVTIQPAPLTPWWRSA